MHLSCRHGSREISFEVRFRPRKTMEIRVEGPNRVVVIAPRGTAQKDILAWVQTKSAWVLDKLQRFSQMESTPVIRELEDGNALLYLGRYYPVEVEFDATASRTHFTLLPDSVLIRTAWPEEALFESSLEGWYRARARDLVVDRIAYFRPYIPVPPGRVVIKTQRRRWGSCSSKGNLNFNWKIILIPPDIFDYVVVHELSHLVHLNHSRAFWQLVASILPDYKEYRNWLRSNPILMNS